MKIFVFDTETTWFINKTEKDLTKQPKIIQFAWILCETWWDGKCEIIEEVNFMINPRIPIPYDSSLVHHIYDIDVKDAPFMEDKIDSIIHYINTPDIIIGHNIEFDEEMIKLELKRLWREYDYKPKQTLCTMKNSVNICKIEISPGRFKYPKLWELHKHLFGEYFIWAHDALVDVKATLKCFEKMYASKQIQVESKKQELLSLF